MVAADRQVNVHEAKTHLSRLLAEVEAGEEIVIARDGTPVARLVRAEATHRRLGLYEGLIDIDDAFDAPLPDDLAAVFDGHA